MEYKLTNSRGTTVTLAEEGAAVRSVTVVDRQGCFSNIALTPSASIKNASSTGYAGATLGPTAGRVPESWLLLGAATVRLQPNEGKHHLHGGANSLSDRRWQCADADGARLRFTCYVSAQSDGFPGNRRFQVIYSLSEDNRLTIRLRAETDAPTWVSLSNHLYWNLSGRFDTTVRDHQVCIAARHVCWNDADHIPMDIRDTAATPLDLRCDVTLSALLNQPHTQLQMARGFNHLYILDSAQAAFVRHPASGRTLALSTDLPVLMFYSGGYLDGSLALAGGGHASPGCALALEPQLMPVTPFARQARPITTPQAPFDHWIAYDFGLA